MKHDIGDRVKIKPLAWYNENRGANTYVDVRPYGFNKYMADCCGKEARIMWMGDDYYTLNIDDGVWKWTDEMFDDTTERTEEQIKSNKMKYKVGDRVRINSRKWYEENKEEDAYVDTQLYWFSKYMVPYCGMEAVIVEVNDDYYMIDIDDKHWKWTDEMFEGIAERSKEQTKSNKMKYKKGDKVRVKSLEWYDKYKQFDGVVRICSHAFLERMSEHCGKEATILSVCESCLGYRIDIDDGFWWWSDEALEPIAEAKNSKPNPFKKTTEELADTLEKEACDCDGSSHSLLNVFGAMYPIICLSEKLEKMKILAKCPNIDKKRIKDGWRDLAWYCMLTLSELGEERK